MYMDFQQYVGDSLIDVDSSHRYDEGFGYYVVDYIKKKTVLKDQLVAVDMRGWVMERALIPVMPDAVEFFNAL